MIESVDVEIPPKYRFPPKSPKYYFLRPFYTLNFSQLTEKDQRQSIDSGLNLEHSTEVRHYLPYSEEAIRIEL